MQIDNYIFVDTYQSWKIFYNADADKYMAQHMYNHHEEMEADTYKEIVSKIDNIEHSSSSIFEVNKLRVHIVWPWKGNQQP